MNLTLITEKNWIQIVINVIVKILKFRNTILALDVFYSIIVVN